MARKTKYIAYEGNYLLNTPHNLIFPIVVTAGFSHRENTQSLDLNSVRLCFQVFLEGNEKGAFTFALKPVVSEPIFDKSKHFEPNSLQKVSSKTSFYFIK